MTVCLRDVFSPCFRGTQKVPTKGPSLEGTAPTPPRQAYSICQNWLLDVDWPQMCPDHHPWRTCSSELGMGGSHGRQEFRLEGCFCSFVRTYSTGSCSCRGDGRLATLGCHESVIMGIEGDSSLHLQAAAAVRVRYPSSFQKVLTLLGSWGGMVPGSVMRVSPNVTASGILPCREEWFSNRSISLYLSIYLMFKLTWRDIGLSLAHPRPSSVSLPAGFWNPCSVIVMWKITPQALLA